jgi:hypothetical protein
MTEIDSGVNKVIDTLNENVHIPNDLDDVLDEQYDDINTKSTASVNTINTNIQTKNEPKEMDNMFPGFDLDKINEIKNKLKGMPKHKLQKYLSEIMKQPDLGVENILPDTGRRPREDIKTRLRRKLQEKREQQGKN